MGGYDIASYAHAGGAVTVDLSLSGGYQNTGSAGQDKLFNIEGLLGSNHADHLTGNSADNWIEGGLGDDTIDGGDGFDDIASYAHASGAVTVDLTKVGVAQDTVNAGSDTLSNIEGIEGSSYDDTLIGNDVANSIYANRGHDSAVGGGGNDTFYVSVDHLPSSIDGGARDGGDGNAVVLQDLVGGAYDMATLATKLHNIDTLNIRGDGVATAITISGLDVQNMVGNPDPAASKLVITADNGDTFDLSQAAKDAGQHFDTAPVVDNTYIILDGSDQQIAQIQWNAA